MTFCGKGVSADVTGGHVKDLEVIWDYQGDPKCNHKCPYKRKARGEDRQKRSKHRKTEAEAGATQLEA